MEALWRWIISVLVWLSAEPGAVTSEAPAAAAAVAVAYAEFAPEPKPEPAPPRPVGPVTVQPAKPAAPPCPGGNCPIR